jgi:dolichyl-phosphate beta-glucosyltransferase
VTGAVPLVRSPAVPPTSGATSTACSLVVPLFDEEERFRDYAADLVAVVAGLPPGSELLLVDDGSSDRTAELAEALAADAPVPVQVLRLPHRGKGAAVAAGIRAATAPMVAFSDLDLSTPPADLVRVIRTAEDTGTLAMASRDLLASSLVLPESRVREALGRAYNRLIQLTVAPGVVDTQCGAKAAPREVWERLVVLTRELGFAWDAELVAVALATGTPVTEVPVTWRHDDRSKVRVLRDGVRMLVAVPRIVGSWRRAARTGVVAEGASGTWQEELARVQARHWWFRGKAALVATALRRTGEADGVLVDAGAGAGGVTFRLGWPRDRVVVAEVDAGLARAARRRHGLQVVRGDAASLPISAGGATVVCLLDVIEHLEDPAGALGEARRVLQPGGRLVVTVPAYQWLFSGADRLLGHHRRYSRRALLRELDRNGFDTELATYVFSYLLPPLAAVRLLLRRGQEETGLAQAGVLVDRAALVLAAVERRLLGRVPLPFGTSVLAVARPRP